MFPGQPDRVLLLLARRGSQAGAGGECCSSSGAAQCILTAAFPGERRSATSDTPRSAGSRPGSLAHVAMSHRLASAVRRLRRGSQAIGVRARRIGSNVHQADLATGRQRRSRDWPILHNFRCQTYLDSASLLWYVWYQPRTDSGDRGDALGRAQGAGSPNGGRCWHAFLGVEGLLGRSRAGPTPAGFIATCRSRARAHARTHP